MHGPSGRCVCVCTCVCEKWGIELDSSFCEVDEQVNLLMNCTCNAVGGQWRTKQLQTPSLPPPFPCAVVWMLHPPPPCLVLTRRRSSACWRRSTRGLPTEVCVTHISLARIPIMPEMAVSTVSLDHYLVYHLACKGHTQPQESTWVKQG